MKNEPKPVPRCTEVVEFEEEEKMSITIETLLEAGLPWLHEFNKIQISQVVR